MNYRSVLKSSFFGAFLGAFIVRVASVLATFACSVALARALGAESYGVYAFVFALATMIALPAQAGLPTIVLRETSKSKAIFKFGRMKGVWVWAGSIVVCIAIASLLISTLVVGYLYQKGLPKEYSQTFLLGLLVALLIAAGNTRGAALRGLGFIVRAQVPETVLRPMVFIFFIVFCLLYGPKLSPTSAMVGHLIAALTAFFIGSYFLWKSRPVELSSVEKEMDSRKWLVSILPLAGMVGMQTVSTQADILILGYFGSAAEVGIYKVVVSGAALAIFGLQVTGSVVSPYFASSFAVNDFRKIQKIAAFGSLISTLLTMPVFFVFLFWGGSLLKLVFGTDFSDGHVALSILSGGQMVNAFFGSSVALLNMCGYEKATVRALMVSASVNVGLNLLLIPIYGINGAAAATACSIIVLNIYLWFLVKKYIGVDSTFVGLIFKTEK